MRDVRYRPLGVAEASTPLLFLPLLQQYGRLGGLTLHVRPGGEPLGFEAPKEDRRARGEGRSVIWNRNHNHVEYGLAQMHAAAEATSAVSVVSLILALAGIFAAIAYQVAQEKWKSQCASPWELTLGA